jgi:beta-lactam-binding protein with PASTA domain
MGELFRYIFSKSFVKNLILAFAVLMILIFLLFALMRIYTGHGEVQPIPNLVGMELNNAHELLNNESLRLVIEDSAYVEDASPGTIISQNPSHGYMKSDSSGIQQRMVKENRKIYVTLASYLPPKVEIPDMVGKSKRIALSLLEITGIKVESMEYVPDNVCTDCVLKQLYKGKEIEPGTRIYKGEGITLVLGKKNARYVSIPKISGFKYSEAKTILNRVSLNIGQITGGCEGCVSQSDSSNAYILKQYPDFGSSVEVGTSIDVYLTQDASLIDR